MDDNNEQHAVCNIAVSTWTWRDRLRCRYFPSKHCFTPVAPSHYKDCISIDTVNVLSFADRLRCLITGVVVVKTCTVTENTIGRCFTNDVCYIGTRRDIPPQQKDDQP